MWSCSRSTRGSQGGYTGFPLVVSDVVLVGSQTTVGSQTEQLHTSAWLLSLSWLSIFPQLFVWWLSVNWAETPHAPAWSIFVWLEQTGEKRCRFGPVHPHPTCTAQRRSSCKGVPLWSMLFLFLGYRTYSALSSQQIMCLSSNTHYSEWICQGWPLWPKTIHQNPALWNIWTISSTMQLPQTSLTAQSDKPQGQGQRAAHFFIEQQYL